MARRRRSALDRRIPTAIIVFLLVLIVVWLSQDLTGRLLLAVCFLASVAAFVFWKVWPRWKQLQRFRALELDDVDAMPGHDFEHYVGRLLQEQGFRITVTKGSGDLGVDVIARKDRVAYAVQCKRSGENISRRAVSDAVAGKQHYKCTQAMVVTNRYFRSGAQELAKSTDCILVDRKELSAWVERFRRQRVAQQITKQLLVSRRPS